jgi:hypothetical protein
MAPSRKWTAPLRERHSLPICAPDMTTRMNPPPSPRDYLLHVLGGAGGTLRSINVSAETFP